MDNKSYGYYWGEMEFFETTQHRWTKEFVGVFNDGRLTGKKTMFKLIENAIKKYNDFAKEEDIYGARKEYEELTRLAYIGKDAQIGFKERRIRIGFYKENYEHTNRFQFTVVVPTAKKLEKWAKENNKKILESGKLKRLIFEGQEAIRKINKHREWEEFNELTRLAKIGLDIEEIFHKDFFILGLNSEYYYADESPCFLIIKNLYDFSEWMFIEMTRHEEVNEKYKIQREKEKKKAEKQKLKKLENKKTD